MILPKQSALVMVGKLLYFLLLLVSTVSAQKKPDPICGAVLRNDTLYVYNDKMEACYRWNGGNLVLTQLHNKETNRSSVAGPGSPDLFLSEALSTASQGKLQTLAVAEDGFTASHLLVEVTFNLQELEVKRRLRIFPGIAAIQSTFYLRGKAQQWSNTGQTADRGMIENVKLPKDQLPATLGAVPLSGNHWKIKSVQFADATDHHNNLVQTEEYLAFRQSLQTTGSLLFATHLLADESVIIYKQSPLGASQQAYPGFDFAFDLQSVKIAGLGIAPQNLSAEHWTESYSFVLALASADEVDQLATLRQYQQAERLYQPHRDAMRVVNTWGDRSRDSRMNEKFIIGEIQSAARLGLTHIQLDDGWQAGLSRNSASADGKLWNQWSLENWQPHPQRFPNGFAPIAKEAKKRGIRLGLWFNPSKKDCYADWERDANLLISYYQKYDFRIIKIDGIELECKESEERLQKLFQKVQDATKGNVSFNLDVTAGRRPGFHYMGRYGNIFLENRYTDWANYYPHWTLRNLWQLSRYVPAERLQIEFLNKWRNAKQYPAGDPLAPAAIPFDYLVAITLMGQPLAWLETSSLPEEAFAVSELLKTYGAVEKEIHSGVILPIGHEPDGTTWTGFQSLHDKKGYLLVFREYNQQDKAWLKTWLPANAEIKFEKVAGYGSSFSAKTNAQSEVEFSLPSAHSFTLYTYTLP